MKKEVFRKIGLYAGCLLFFVLVAYGFVPQVLGGKIVDQSDISGYLGMRQEAVSWNRAHPDDPTAWTGSMFSGMPTTMITGNPAGDGTKPLFNLLLTGRRPASYLLISLLGAFLLMLSLGVRPWLAAGGAVAVTFCSYNLQILQVGHNTKMLALAFAPWVLAAVIFTYKQAFRREDAPFRKHWLPGTVFGALLFAFALSLQIKADHVQITWYLALIILCYVIGLIVWLCLGRLRTLGGRFFTASALLLVLGAAGIGTNANKLIPAWTYARQTMRGGSELSGGEKKGLSLDYATAWSYGWEELPNLMVPDFNGGSSVGELPMDSQTVRLLKQAGQPNLRQVAKALPLYWGPQPFTAGPMYMGAITIFLFLLGLLLCEGKDRWWMLAAAVLATGLALGNHLMPLTRFFYDHVPFYSKFRTVSMALVVLQVVLPMLGFLALERLLREEVPKETFLKRSVWAFALTGGVCLLLALFPGLAGSFSGSADAGQPEALVTALAADRRMLLRHDAWISFFLILAAYLLLLWSYFPKGQTGHARSFAETGRRTIAAGGICLLVLLNLFTVGKRYLNASHFTTPKAFESQFDLREADRRVLADPDPNYRVLDLTVNVFNDSHPSYHHKNIGGYSPAKLQRYQDLIDHYLSQEIRSLYTGLQQVEDWSDVSSLLQHTPILNLLNDKYLILGADLSPVRNPYAMGNAWFVDSTVVAATPDEEIALLGTTPLRTTAVLGPDFADVAAELAGLSAAQPTFGDSLALTSYAPNELHYAYRTSAPRAAVFSEIWYPNGWTARLEDGTPVDLFRADWTLRGALLPAGDHELILRFDPPSYTVGSRISRASSWFLYLLLVLVAGGLILHVKHGKTEE